ncbi:E3 ubiquitin-protein ligase makorin [Dirofilaria immitis]
MKIRIVDASNSSIENSHDPLSNHLIVLLHLENETEDSAHMAAASTTTVTSKILCRYFANNICREGSSCPFSHDRNSKPDRTCRYYLIGKCAFGTSCRYDHKRPPLDGIKTVKSFSRAAENSSSAKVVENGCSSDSIATTAAVNQSNHVFSVDAAEFIPSWKISALNEANTNASGSLVSLPLCPYFETGNCDKGDKCQFVHGDMCDLCNVPCLHPTDMEQRAQHRRECMDAHEAAMEEAFAEARSADKVCGICMENIRETKSRFGILEGCRHCFCLDCIRQWRGNQNDHFGKKTVRSCPECRTHSNFVIPATYWIEDQADKDDLIARFRENAKQKQCKYVKEGYIDDCPFGNKCFYKHELPDGTIVEGDSPRTLQRRRLSLLTGVWSFSDSDSEDDFSRIAQGIISRAFSLV